MSILQKDIFKRSSTKWLIAFGCTLTVFCATLLLFGIRYDTNDDATISNIAAGAYGEHSQYIVYSNILLGYLMKALFALFPSVSWYVVIQLALVVVAFSVIHKQFMNRFGATCGGIMGLCFTVFFGYHLFHRFQYTQNAAVIIAAGLLLIAGNLGRINMQTVCGILLVYAGAIVRIDSFFMVGALSAALLILRFIPLSKKEKYIAVGSMAAVFIGVFALEAVDTLSYTLSAEWGEYYSYNAARMEFSDNRAMFLPPENILQSLGYSQNDYAMLQTWNFFDTGVFPTESLRAASQLAPSPSLGSTLILAVANTANMLFGSAYSYFFLFSSLALVAVCTLKRLWYVLSTYFVLFLLVVYLSSVARMPQRIEVSLLLAALLFALFCAEVKTGKRYTKPTLAAALSLVLILSAPFFFTLRTEATGYLADRMATNGDYDAISADKQNLYVCSVDEFNTLAGFDVFAPREKGYFSNIVTTGGWLSNSPFSNDVLANYGVSSPLLDSVDAPNVYVSNINFHMTSVYIEEHSGTAVASAEPHPTHEQFSRFVSA